MKLYHRTGRITGLLPLLVVLLFTAPLCRAQDYVARYDAFAGFSNISAPFVNDLEQPGFGTQVGYLPRRWLATGFDYSIQSGSTNLTPNLLTPALQQQLAASLPPGYNLSVRTNLTIQTFTAGPQLVYRSIPVVTLFIHPVLSAFRVSATPRPTDAIATFVSNSLVPHGTKIDWSGAYGVGGGGDIHLTRHLSARVSLDAAYTHPMNDILGKGGWIYRFTVGPAFHFGPNVPAHRKRS